ncbi:MAG: YIP1 family protein [Planctomycetes bacterium]|nr:YIP1 family protein [Planctomycetota bacterium]
MKCPHCDYLLFNLSRPVCPECGRSFDVSRYRFEAGAVSFNCPHCDQDYYGNDAHGLPSPSSFVCVKCDKTVSLGEMRVVPIHADAMGVRIDASPWDERAHNGLRRSWWRSLTMTMFRGGEFFRKHQGTSIKESWLYAMISLYVGFIPYCLLQLLLTLVVMGVIVNRTGGTIVGAPPMMMFAAIWIGTALVGPLVLPLLGSAIVAAYVHPVVMLVADKRKTFGYTYRTVMYSLGPVSLYAVPFCGTYAAYVWTAVTLTFGIKEVHHTTGLRAAIAVLWLPVALMLTGLVVLTVILVRDVALLG